MAAQSNSEMIEELYNKIGKTDQAVAKLSAQMEMSLMNFQRNYEQNQEFIKLVKENNDKYTQLISDNTDKYIRLMIKIGSTFAFFLLITTLALIYGAVGEKGMKSVRDTVPALPKASYIPWFHDKFTTGGSTIMV